MIREDLQAVLERDPSAGSRIEVILTNPGFHAVLFHRLCHVLWRWGLRLLPRWVAMLGRFITGVEIHPAVRIGRRFFIDHGAGVVIGETARIGDDVTLYHQVTLGGIAPALNSARQAQQKRHPTIKDGVIIGSGAQILGPVTVGSARACRGQCRRFARRSPPIHRCGCARQKGHTRCRVSGEILCCLWHPSGRHARPHSAGG